MSGPNKKLTELYSNEDLYQAKLAGIPSLISMLWGLHLGARTVSKNREQQRQEAEAEMMNAMLERAEARRMAPMLDATRYARVPRILGAGVEMSRDSMGLGPFPYSEMMAPRGPRQYRGDDVPLGMDEGMIRIAHAMRKTAELMARQDVELAKQAAGAASLLGAVAKKSSTLAMPAVKSVTNVAKATGKTGTLAGAPLSSVVKSVPQVTPPKLPGPPPASTATAPAVRAPSAHAGMTQVPKTERPPATQSMQGPPPSLQGPATVAQPPASGVTKPSTRGRTQAVPSVQAPTVPGVPPTVSGPPKTQAMSSAKPTAPTPTAPAAAKGGPAVQPAPAAPSSSGAQSAAPQSGTRSKAAPTVKDAVPPTVSDPKLQAPGQAQAPAPAPAAPATPASGRAAPTMMSPGATPPGPMAPPVSPVQSQGAPAPTPPPPKPSVAPAPPIESMQFQHSDMFKGPATNVTGAPSGMAPSLAAPPSMGPSSEVPTSRLGGPSPSVMAHDQQLAQIRRGGSTPAPVSAAPATNVTGPPSGMAPSVRPAGSTMMSAGVSQGPIPTGASPASVGKPATPGPAPVAAAPSVQGPVSQAAPSSGGRQAQLPPPPASTPSVQGPASQGPASQTPASQANGRMGTQQFQAVEQKHLQDTAGRQQQMKYLENEIRANPNGPGAVNNAAKLQQLKKTEAEAGKTYGEAFQAHHGQSLEDAQSAVKDLSAAPKEEGMLDKLKRKATIGGVAGAAGLAALGYGGYKLLNKGMDIMGQEGRTGEVYGTPMGMAPTSVNQYGQPMY